MSDKIVFVVPAEGLTILDDLTFEVLPAEGKRVRMSSYWDKMQAQGSIEIKADPEVKAVTEEKK